MTFIRQGRVEFFSDLLSLYTHRLRFDTLFWHRTSDMTRTFWTNISPARFRWSRNHIVELRCRPGGRHRLVWFVAIDWNIDLCVAFAKEQRENRVNADDEPNTTTTAITGCTGFARVVFGRRWRGVLSWPSEDTTRKRLFPRFIRSMQCTCGTLVFF